MSAQIIHRAQQTASLNGLALVADHLERLLLDALRYQRKLETLAAADDLDFAAVQYAAHGLHDAAQSAQALSWELERNARQARGR